MKTVSATAVSLILLLQPALSFLWDILLFKRPTSGYEYLGIALILLAIYFGSLRKKEKPTGLS
jgi:drug/metabolite transporter (DMT)-like permease